MKMLCDEQLGCGARGQPPTLASLHRSPGPWCRMSPLACTGHNTTQSSVVCTADHNTRLLVSGYLQNWAILSRCITGDMLQCHATNQNNATTITDITAVSSDQWMVMDAAVLQSVASHPALQLMEPLIMG